MTKEKTHMTSGMIKIFKNEYEVDLSIAAQEIISWHATGILNGNELRSLVERIRNGESINPGVISTGELLSMVEKTILLRIAEIFSENAKRAAQIEKIANDLYDQRVEFLLERSALKEKLDKALEAIKDADVVNI